MNKARGFTLIELLVVMVLIAALFSAVNITTGTKNSKRDLIEEGKRIQALFTEASQHAILYNQEIGWYFDKENYSFLSYDFDDNKWAQLNQRMFKSRPVNYEIELTELDGVPIAERLNDIYKNPSSPEDNDALVPSIVFLSSGEYSSFEMVLFEESDSDWQIKIVSDGFAEAELVLPFDLEDIE
ncbi:type II secretion system minor pseudopilin GspH [Litoribrevibacter euphylliae]|uniref:Type II secretion system protein H n=1 Tax=Litoribrevibacter euphylliae TaxID=1834034 RepID=A0ABV7HG90_9GAMM